MQIIDAGMIAFAAWHALKGRVNWPLTFQVPRMLRATLRDLEEPYVLCWNAERLRKREKWPDYRDRPEIWEQADAADFDRMLEVLSALGAVQYRADGWEADEVIAALVHRLESREEPPLDQGITIRSDDKDFMQLLSGSVRMEGRRRGTVRFSDVSDILGVSPAFVADFLALAGDEADGIPRIVTPSVARELIETRGHVLDWLDRDLQVDPDVKEAIESNREQLRLNYQLVDLSREAVGEPPEPMLEGRGDLARAREIGAETGIGYLQGENLEEEYGLLSEYGQSASDVLRSLA